MIAFRISRVVGIDLGFRYLYVDYESGRAGTPGFFAYEADQFGILLAVGFAF